MKRERYIPEGSTEIKGEGVVIYAYESSKGGPAAICYGGKRAKSDWHFRYQNEQLRDDRVEETLAAYAEAAERKRKEKAAKKSAVSPYTVGDVLSCSWGYDQTNWDFYEVTRVTKRSVEIRPLSKDSVAGTQWLTGTCTPKPGCYIGEPRLKRVCFYTATQTDGGVRAYINIASYASASLWDGTPKHWTAYA